MELHAFDDSFTEYGNAALVSQVFVTVCRVLGHEACVVKLLGHEVQAGAEQVYLQSLARTGIISFINVKDIAIYFHVGIATLQLKERGERDVQVKVYFGFQIL